MRKVIVIIRVYFVQSAIDRAVFFLIAFILLIATAKSQSIAIGSKSGCNKRIVQIHERKCHSNIVTRESKYDNLNIPF